MRTLAAILVFALPAGWAAYAATDSGTDHKAAPPKSTAKKGTSTKTSTPITPSKSSIAKTGVTTKTGASTTKTGTAKPATTKTGVSNTNQIASKNGTAKSGTATGKSGATSTAKNTTGKTNPKLQAPTRYRRPAQLQPTSDRYKEIQQALADKGYFGGSPDGAWGATSVDALKRFQHDQSLVEDGKIGSLSLIALGLGPHRGGASVLAAPAHTPDRPSAGAPSSDAEAPPPAEEP